MEHHFKSWKKKFTTDLEKQWLRQKLLEYKVKRGDLFCALNGENFNGHDFIISASERGATACLISENLINTKKIEDVIEFSKSTKKLLVVTRGDKGAIAINDEVVVECNAKKDIKLVDLTGAGDLFASGFLHGHINGRSLKESLEKGTEMSSRVIQQIGARL